MKKVVFSITALLVMLLVSSFIIADRAAEDVRKLDSFDGIGISVSADVFYTQGNSHEIRIEGPDRDVNDLITKVKDGFLQVKYENNRFNRSKLTIHITSKELEDVKISGSAHFKADRPVTSDEIDMAISGSGGVLFNKLVSDEIGMKISGSGVVELAGGNADELDVKISGSGKLKAEEFVVSECSATLSGSGSVRITAHDELDARMSGSCKVYYHGDPQVNSISSGSGKVIAL
ncbi:MAG: head GIN domain-containing protein [Bacteroidota bacterium]